MIIAPQTWLAAKRLEAELLASEGARHLLHPKTIWAIAMYHALNEGAPTSSALTGLSTLALTFVDNLQERGLPVPPELNNACKSLVALAAELRTHSQNL